MSQLADRATSVFVRRREPSQSVAQATDPYGRWTVGVILTVMACQLLFLLVGCDWDFCGDEAEYWAWSRRLDWSYFSRGPLIAWVIRAATEVFGGMSLRLTGSLMFAARLPAVLLGGLTAWGIFRLASTTTGSRRSGMFAAILLPAIPIFAIGGVLITSDTPLVCCWTWAAVWAYRAVQTDRLDGWIFAGFLAALGVLAKYSVLAFPASVGLFLLLSGPHRRQLGRPGFWLMSILCIGLGLSAVVVWNAQHGWAGAGQLADRVGLSDRASWGSIWPILGFLGGEAAVLGGVWWIAGLTVIASALSRVFKRAKRHNSSTDSSATRESDSPDPSGTMFLLCLWGVTWCACLAASILGETEANWMVQGYVGDRRPDRAAIRRGGRARGEEVPGLCRRVVFLRRRGGRVPSLRVVLSDHRQMGTLPVSPLGGPVTDLRRDLSDARSPRAGEGRAAPSRGTRGRRDQAVRHHADLCPDLDPVLLPAGTARDLLPELELRHDRSPGQPARPLAPQSASRPESLLRAAIPGG